MQKEKELDLSMAQMANDKYNIERITKQLEEIYKKNILDKYQF